MKVKRNTSLLAGFVVLAIFYFGAGYFSLYNLKKSREITERNNSVLQPSILMLNELKLQMVSSKAYINTWVSVDISDHPEKVLLKKIHNEDYPQLRDEIKEIMLQWEGEEVVYRDSVKELLASFEEVLEQQQNIMQRLDDITAYELDPFTAIEIQNTLDIDIKDATIGLILNTSSLIENFDSLKAKEDVIVSGKQATIRKTNIAIFISVILITIAVGVIAVRASKLNESKIKANAERDAANAQREIIEKKNKEILESIAYAKRIQRSLFPNKEVLDHALGDYFILYLPKDIVSGDFYWGLNTEEGDYLFAVADSTGHGVPGAFVSIICNKCLNSAVSEFGITQPSQVLEKARTLLVDSFDSSNQEDVRDGMDVSLCKINRKKMELEFAGANNSLYLIRNEKVKELKGCRQPVGKYENMKNFENHKLQLEKGDMLYMFSDGYVDQFGGKRGKKLKSKRLLDQLTKLAELPTKEQNEKLHDGFLKWKGNEEQVDDVLVVGIKV